MLRLFVFSCVTVISSNTYANELYDLPDLDVDGRGTPLVGEAISASHGTVGRVDLETRPITRVGEILETVPGMIATQHSGSGKANQYFLRGFNLDHGTDFATWVEGMPVNMPTHGHGQGYTDLNFLIPEAVDTVTYLKGPYYAGVGDFSSAGSAHIGVLDTIDDGELTLSIGEDDLFRLVVLDSIELGEQSNLLYALERETNDGPWELAEKLDKVNGLFKYSKQLDDQEFSITAMAYNSEWNSTDQVPERAIESGLISDLGFLDPTVGGNSSRYSLSGEWRKGQNGERTSVSAYAIYYDLNLWSNFTYFLDDPINGDQFEQADQRMIYGFAATQELPHFHLFNRDFIPVAGIQARYDDVAEVGLYRTSERERLSTTREDEVAELSLGAFYDLKIHWSSKLKTSIGLRMDYYDFDVTSVNPANSGAADDTLISPRFSSRYQLSDDTELYLSAGYGFHSNDARGTTITVDPAEGEAIDAVDPLVKSLGYEVGFRKNWGERSNTSVAIWRLDLDSELLFVGDAGNTEESRPSRRQGIEFASYFAFTDWLSLDLDLALSDSEFTDNSPDGNEIPGAIGTVASAGININDESGWFGSLRYRHFGAGPLIEDDSVRSDDFDAYNLRIGFAAERWRASIDILNLFDSNDQDITYFYESRLPGEADEGVAGIHQHRISPRTIRANLSWLF
ncbi:TonB-dependent receptor [Puniceicoccaceae bacterium K14]|nr:TonB-dependent receptor [Puniceicoccaceae bacterium K14]